MLDLKLFLFAFLVAAVECYILQYNERKSDNATYIMWGACVVFPSQNFRSSELCRRHSDLKILFIFRIVVLISKNELHSLFLDFLMY